MNTQIRLITLFAFFALLFTGSSSARAQRRGTVNRTRSREIVVVRPTPGRDYHYQEVPHQETRHRTSRKLENTLWGALAGVGVGLLTHGNLATDAIIGGLAGNVLTPGGNHYHREPDCPPINPFGNDHYNYGQSYLHSTTVQMNIWQPTRTAGIEYCRGANLYRSRIGGGLAYLYFDSVKGLCPFRDQNQALESLRGNSEYVQVDSWGNPCQSDFSPSPYDIEGVRILQPVQPQPREGVAYRAPALQAIPILKAPVKTWRATETKGIERCEQREEIYRSFSTKDGCYIYRLLVKHPDGKYAYDRIADQDAIRSQLQN